MHMYYMLLCSSSIMDQHLVGIQQLNYSDTPSITILTIFYEILLFMLAAGTTTIKYVLHYGLYLHQTHRFLSTLEKILHFQI
jgi:hypothetical protein